MRKGSVVTVSRFTDWSIGELGEKYIYLGKEGDYVKLVGLDGTGKYYAFPHHVEKVKGENPFTVASKRSGGYVFTAMQRDKTLILSAGCRIFNSIKAAKQHWSNGKNGHHWEYKDTSYTEGKRHWEDRKEMNKKHLAAMTEVYNNLKEKLA